MAEGGLNLIGFWEITDKVTGFFKNFEKTFLKDSHGCEKLLNFAEE